MPKRNRLWSRSSDFSRGPNRVLHYWRTKSGNEVDFVLYGRDAFCVIEVKNFGRLKESMVNGLLAFKADYPEGGNAPGLSRPGTHQNKRSPLRPVCGIPGEHGSGKAFLAEKNVLDIIRDLRKDTEDSGRESPETREQRKMVVRWQKGM